MSDDRTEQISKALTAAENATTEDEWRRHMNTVMELAKQSPMRIPGSTNQKRFSDQLRSKFGLTNNVQGGWKK